MGFKRTATAHWEGDLKTGQGRMSTPQSGLFDGTRYSFNTRFGEEKGSNPEELLAAGPVSGSPTSTSSTTPTPRLGAKAWCASSRRS